jgi:hypothetical protein
MRIYRLLSLGVMALLLSAVQCGPSARAQTRFVPQWNPDTGYFTVNFNKNVEAGKQGGCLRRDVSVHYDGHLLVCTIQAPPEAVGAIDRIELRCDGDLREDPNTGIGFDDACAYTHRCPDKGWCKWSNQTPIDYEYEPHDLHLKDTRTVTWYGWTNNGGDAILAFTVYMRPVARP